MPSLDLQADLARLRADLTARGFYGHRLGRFLLAWVTHLTLGFAGCAAFLWAPSLPLRILGLAVSTFGFIGVATLGHTASHNAASGNRTWNRLLVYASYPLVLQLSARFWHHTHVQMHHTSPNILGLDNDCDLRPSFAINEAHVREASPRARRYYRYQAPVFPILLLLNSVNIMRKGWRHLLRELRDPARRCAGTYADLGCMLAHLAAWIVIPMFYFPVWAVLGSYLLRVALVGVGLFAVLAPGHFPAEAAVFERGQREAGDFYLRQTTSTLNFRTGWLGNFLCSGLEYQIEHHLFPSISHSYLRPMSPLVRAFCERQGLPHRTLPWPLAIWKSYLVFFTPKRVLSDVEGLRGQPGAAG